MFQPKDWGGGGAEQRQTRPRKRNTHACQFAGNMIALLIRRNCCFRFLGYFITDVL